MICDRGITRRFSGVLFYSKLVTIKTPSIYLSENYFWGSPSVVNISQAPDSHTRKFILIYGNAILALMIEISMNMFIIDQDPGQYVREWVYKDLC